MPSAIDRYGRIKQYLMGDQDPHDLEALQAAEEQASNDRMTAGIGSGIDKIISSIGGTQANPEAYATMQKYAGEAPTRVREYLKQKYEQRKEAGHTAASLAQAEATADATQSQRDFNNQMARDNYELRKSHEDREAAKGSPAQQEIDKKQGEAAADWIGGGRDKFNAGLSRLENIQKTLEGSEDSMLDKIRARGGEPLLSSDQLKIKQDALNAILPVLKTQLGNNPTEGERNAMLNSVYDPRLSPKQNAANIKQKIDEWRTDAANRDSLSSKYFKTPTTSASAYSSQQEAGIKRVMDQNGISREEAINALKEAKKLP